MLKYQKVEEIEDLDSYTSVDEILPNEDGIYDVIMRCGSIVKYFIKSEEIFRRGVFMKFDWNYVVFWKERIKDA